MRIRKYNSTDSEILAKLFFNTIRNVNIRDYTQAQVEAWAPEKRDSEKWAKSFANKFVFVAESDAGLAGFGELELNGHIDRFYIDANYIGKGVGKLIYAAIETQARNLNIRELFVEASITAKPFFEKMGFTTVQDQTVFRSGIGLSNFIMKKQLEVLRKF